MLAQRSAGEARGVTKNKTLMNPSPLTRRFARLRVIGTSLLLLHSSRLMLGFLAFDMIMFFLYKVARRDLTHWVPAEGVLRLVETFFARFFFKIVNDYTGIAHFRHPHEIGGLYWFISIVSTQAFVWVAFLVVIKVHETPCFVPEATLIFFLAFLNLAFGVAFITFFTNIKAEYLHTFFSRARGIDFSLQIFENGKHDDPERRMQIITINRVHWKR